MRHPSRSRDSRVRHQTAFDTLQQFHECRCELLHRLLDPTPVGRLSRQFRHSSPCPSAWGCQLFHPGIERGHSGAAVDVRGSEFRCGRVSLEGAGHLVSVHARHHDVVEQDQVRCVLRNGGQCLFARGGSASSSLRFWLSSSTMRMVAAELLMAPDERDRLRWPLGPCS